MSPFEQPQVGRGFTIMLLTDVNYAFKMMSQDNCRAKE